MVVLLFFFFSSPLDNMRYGSKTCPSCRKILMFVFIEGSEGCIFVWGKTLEFAKPPSTDPRKDSNDDIQGVTGGTDQTSGGCSLGQTIPKKPKTPISKVERFGR